MLTDVQKERLSNEFHKRYDKNFKKIEIFYDNDSESDKISILNSKILIEVEGYEFKEVEITFHTTELTNHHRLTVIDVTSKIEIKSSVTYPIEVGLFYQHELLRFSPITLNPSIYNSDYHHWLSEKANMEKGIDKLSRFFNKKTKFINNLLKWLNLHYTHYTANTSAAGVIGNVIAGGLIVGTLTSAQSNSFKFYLEAPIKIIPNKSKPNSLIIKISQLMRISKGKVLPSINFKNIFKAYKEVIKSYNEFLSNFNVNEYPHNEYLEGPEQFTCRKCNSILFPSKILKKRG